MTEHRNGGSSFTAVFCQAAVSVALEAGLIRTVIDSTSSAILLIGRGDTCRMVASLPEGQAA